MSNSAEDVRLRFLAMAQKYNWKTPSQQSDNNSKPRLNKSATANAFSSLPIPSLPSMSTSVDIESQPPPSNSKPSLNTKPIRRRRFIADSDSDDDDDDDISNRENINTNSRNQSTMPIKSSTVISSSVTPNHYQYRPSLGGDDSDESTESESVHNNKLRSTNKAEQSSPADSISRYSSSSATAVLSEGHSFGLLNIELSDAYQSSSQSESESQSRVPIKKPSQNLRNTPNLVDLCSSESSDSDVAMVDKPTAMPTAVPTAILTTKQPRMKPKKRSRNKPQKSVNKRPNIAKLSQKMGSLALSDNPNILCDDAHLTFKQFSKQRLSYTEKLFTDISNGAFNKQLVWNDNVTVQWANSLNKRAGDCRFLTVNKVRKARIRLATKVLDSLERLKQTLCHEMCHAMQWIANANKKPPHGTHFQYWARKAEAAFRDITVTTCHSYKIHFKFQWKCKSCDYKYGRHSNSIDPTRHRCGVCKGELEFLGRFKPDGTVVATRKNPSAFSLFVKNKFANIRKQYPAASHGEVMRILGQLYKASKT